MDVFEAIKDRRSVRSFSKQPVSTKEVMSLIEVARWAPSAGNIQPWKFIIVRDPKVKHGLAVAA